MPGTAFRPLRSPFKEATVETILRLERPTPQHLHWAVLDVDVGLDSIEHPERYRVSR